MSIELHVEPNTPPVSWDDFRANYPPGSIAFDGFVSGAPKIDPTGPYANFNHHEDVLRLATLSTAQQALRFARMGLDQTFRKDGRFFAHVFVNDCDQDSCASVSVVENISMAKDPHNPMLNRFIEVTGTLDATAGAYPYDPDLEYLAKVDWVFEPYNIFKNTGDLERREASEFRSIIESVGHRIQRHLLGDPSAIFEDYSYLPIGGGLGWTMIESPGAQGHVGALRNGIDAYIKVSTTDDPETWRCTLGKRSELIAFPLQAILDDLNEAEGCGEDRWGGNLVIAGSPRISGTHLPPLAIEAIANNRIALQS